MKSTFEVGNISAKPGTVSCGYLPFGYLNDSSSVEIPIILVNGSEPGPTLWIGSTMHGIEIGGIEVIRKITREIVDPSQFKGQIIAWPILNPYAFRDAMTNTPQDLANINRVFPGGSKQLVSHRLAHLIMKYMPLADYVIDFHSNVEPSLVHTIVKPAPDIGVRARSLDMANAFGATVVFVEQVIENTPSDGVPKSGSTFTECTIAAGKPTITVELSNSRRLDPDSIEAGICGVQNVMHLLGMVEKGSGAQDRIRCLPGIYARTVMTADVGGLVTFVKLPGERIVQGEVILQVRNPIGDLIQEIKSPIDGYPLAYPLQGNQAVGTGDYLAFLISKYAGNFLEY